MRLHRSPEARGGCTFRRLPFLCLSVSGRNLRLRRSGLRRTLSGQTDSGVRMIAAFSECRPSLATVEFAPHVPMSINRRSSVQVSIGAIRVGGGAPIVVQSMTNTDTADVEGTARQVQALARAGSELVRITVNTSEAAAAVAPLRERLRAPGGAGAPVRGFSLQSPQNLPPHPDVSAPPPHIPLQP